MTAKQFHDELTSLVSRAVKDCNKPHHMTAEQVVRTLGLHANQLLASIQQVQAEHITKSILPADQARA